MQEEKKGVSTQLSLLLGQSLVLVNSNEYENLKKENQSLKERVAVLDHNVDILLQTISKKDKTIEELKKENEELKKKIEILETKLAQQDTRIKKLEYDGFIIRNKDFIMRLIIGFQDLNRCYSLETNLSQKLRRIRKNRNYMCHILECGDDNAEHQTSRVQKAWRYVVSNLDPEISNSG